MEFTSLFAGIGGLDLGLERAGLVCRRQVEKDKACRQVLAHHWPRVARGKDVQKEKPRKGSYGRLLCGGFPCQDLSVAGRRAGLAGRRSGLFFTLLQCLAAAAPPWFLLENVPGLLSSNEGRDMGTVLGCLGQLGYGWAYRVLDAQYFGLAQRRQRVFLVGCLGDAARAFQVLFEPESVCGNPPPRRQEEAGAAEAVAGCLNAGGHEGGFRTEPGEHLTVARCVTTRYGLRQDLDSDNFVVYQQHGSNVGPLGTLRRGNGSMSGGVPVVAFKESQSGTRLGEVHATLDANKGSRRQEGILGDFGIRRLTPLECCRLQGFPDDWLDLEPSLSDSGKYRLLGNAVAVPVAEWIGRRILALE